MQNELREFWSKIFSFNSKFGLFLILIICVPRFILVLDANATGNYSYIGLIMLASAISPFIFLTKYGCREIGLTKPKSYSTLIVAFVSGSIFSLLLYYLGIGLYGTSYDNWFIYIGKSYNIPPGISYHDKNILFAVTALVGITFSPIGEELFFRGVVHSSYAKTAGTKKASIIESSAFALTHLSHFGIIFINNEWSLELVPALIWCSAMFLASLMFIFFKRYSGSILGAITCHAAFNLVMIYCIFYLGIINGK